MLRANFLDNFRYEFTISSEMFLEIPSGTATVVFSGSYLIFFYRISSSKVSWNSSNNLLRNYSSYFCWLSVWNFLSDNFPLSIGSKITSASPVTIPIKLSLEISPEIFLIIRTFFLRNFHCVRILIRIQVEYWTRQNFTGIRRTIQQYSSSGIDQNLGKNSTRISSRNLPEYLAGFY